MIPTKYPTPPSDCVGTHPDAIGVLFACRIIFLLYSGYLSCLVRAMNGVSSTRRCSKGGPSDRCSVISSTSCLGCVDNRRTNRVHSPVPHVRTISTVRLSNRRDDWVPEHPKPSKSRGLLS